jgi:integrase
MKVKLREKALKNGLVSLYLDIYHCKRRWYEFLEIHVNPKKPTEQDKENRILAQQIKTKREHELLVEENGLTDRNKKKADFVQWFAKYIFNKKKVRSCDKSALKMLSDYTEGRPVPFEALTSIWCVGFTDYMQKRVKVNTALCYVCSIFTALERAVKENIILKNPWRGIDKKDRLKKQDTKRNAWTIEQLNVLANTPFKYEPQIRQGYLFSCFSGLRWSDINPLQWCEVIVKNLEGVERWFLYFGQKKTSGIEYLPLSAQAVEILKERKREQELEPESKYVFPMLKEREGGGKLIWDRMNYALKKWGMLAGIESKQMHFHTGRHTFATNMLEHSPDGDLYTVSKLLGHKSINPTQVYAKVRDSRRASAVDSLPMLTFNQSVPEKSPDPTPVPDQQIPEEKETKVVQLIPSKQSA